MLNNKENIYSDDDITQIWGRRAMGTSGLLTNLQKSGPAAMRIDPGFTFCLQSGRLQSFAGSVLLTGVLLRKRENSKRARKSDAIKIAINVVQFLEIKRKLKGERQTSLPDWYPNIHPS